MSTPISEVSSVGCTTQFEVVTSIHGSNMRYAPVFEPYEIRPKESRIMWFNWYRYVIWKYFGEVFLMPILAVICAYWVPIRLYTLLFNVLYGIQGGIGITAGYHRLWTHKSYKATLFLQCYLVAISSSAGQRSIKWWAIKHRAHHRYTDTDNDPYSAQKGLFFSHIGWLMFKTTPSGFPRVEITDLDHDPIVAWQYRYYTECLIITAFIIPTTFCGILWGDWLGGFLYGGLLRIAIIAQITYLVNSLAHWAGEQPYNDSASPRDNALVGLITLGEGYHNFHHEFPSDYRNGVKWYDLDITKWTIRMWERLGLAYDLKRFRDDDIEKIRLQQLQKNLNKRWSAIDCGTPEEKLPAVSWKSYTTDAKKGKALIAISGILYDVTGFIEEHPGGESLILSGVGKDATTIFNGCVHVHSNVARNLLTTMRVGILERRGHKID